MAVVATKVVFEKVDTIPKLIRDGNSRSYIPSDILGTGGFASCWRAQMLDPNTTPEAPDCALKAVKATLPKNLTQRFKLELAIQSKVHHPNLVEMFRAFTVDETTYVALELCPNGSLTDMIKKRKYLTMGEIRRMLIQLCGAVKYLHQRDVVHRDIKAGNIFLDADMNVKLGDFGLAAVMEPAGEASSTTHARRTTFCGTPNYLAPEILDKSGGGHGMSVDIWSIGILAYFLAVGKAPFHAKSKEEIYTKLRKGEYTWPELTPDSNEIPEDLRALVAKLLVEEAKRPSPDKVVRHPFFSQGFIPSRLDPLCKTRRPRWARVGTPEQNLRTYKRLCWESQVGGVVHMDEPMPVKPTSLVIELADEIAQGRGLTIPLKEGLVYRSKPRRPKDGIIFDDAEAQPTTMASPKPTRVLGEIAPNLASPRPKLETKKSDYNVDIFDIKAMRESIDELQEQRASAGTPPDPLGPIRGDSPRVMKTQKTQLNTPRKVARTVQEPRQSPRRPAVAKAATMRDPPRQPSATVQMQPPQPKQVVDLTQSPPMFKTKSTLRLTRPKRTEQAEEVVAERQPEYQQQQQLQSQAQPIPPAEMPLSRRLPSSMRIARTVSSRTGRSTPSIPDAGNSGRTTPALETQTLGRTRRPQPASRTTSATSTTSSSDAAAFAMAAAATALKKSPQTSRTLAQIQADMPAPASPQRQLSRAQMPKRSTSRAVSSANDVPTLATRRPTLEAAISAAASSSGSGTMRRAPRRPRTAAAQGAEGLLMEALTAGDQMPISNQRTLSDNTTLTRRPRRAGVCYD